MRVNNQVGPGGPTGCSKFACVKTAVREFKFKVVHPGQEPYCIVYRLCPEHNQRHADLAEQRRWWYPNFTLIEEKRL